MYLGRFVCGQIEVRPMTKDEESSSVASHGWAHSSSGWAHGWVKFDVETANAARDAAVEYFRRATEPISPPVSKKGKK